MKKEIRDYFEKQNISSFAVLCYADVKEISAEIMAREDFTPKSVIMFVIPYYTGDGENLSRYAVSYDYHRIIRQIGDGLIEVLRRIYPENRFKTYGDHSPIDERHAGLIGGLGILGDNGLLIHEKYG
ncbi:MAG: DUF1730 domain-containing protein, partial [Clostridia bacterium]|nr:DUF1730 domain-containing protein [Clostridia bacterium]